MGARKFLIIAMSLGLEMLWSLCNFFLYPYQIFFPPQALKGADNSSSGPCKDIACGWRMGGGARHYQVEQSFFRYSACFYISAPHSMKSRYKAGLGIIFLKSMLAQKVVGINRFLSRKRGGGS